MLPRLLAEQEMAQFRAVQHGAGRVKKSAVGTYLGVLKRRVKGRKGGGAKPRTPEQWAQLGMRVTYENGKED